MNKTNENAPDTKLVLKGQASEEVIANWKQENPRGIYSVEVDGCIGYLRNPTLQDMNCALAQHDVEQPLKKYKVMAETTWLGGAEEVLENDTYFLSIVGDLQDAAAGLKTRVVKL